jgi:CBS domain-containing protein
MARILHPRPEPHAAPTEGRAAIAAEAEGRLRRSGFPALRTLVDRGPRGVLRLEGRVPSYYLKQAAQAVVAEVEGVRRVLNRIEVISPPGRPPVGIDPTGPTRGERTGTGSAESTIVPGSNQTQSRGSLAQALHKARRRGADEPGGRCIVRAREIMSQPAVTVRRDAGPTEAARLMLEHRFDCLPVVDGAGFLCGIVTESDFAGGELSASTVAEFMSRGPIIASEETPVEELREKMQDHDVNHVPVLRHGKPIGVISRHDLLRAMVDDPGLGRGAAEPSR